MQNRIWVPGSAVCLGSRNSAALWGLRSSWSLFSGAQEIFSYRWQFVTPGCCKCGRMRSMNSEWIQLMKESFLSFFLPHYINYCISLSSRQRQCLTLLPSPHFFISFLCLAWRRQIGVSQWRRANLSFICLFWTGTCGCKYCPVWLGNNSVFPSSPALRRRGVSVLGPFPRHTSILCAAGSPAGAGLESPQRAVQAGSRNWNTHFAQWKTWRKNLWAIGAKSCRRFSWCSLHLRAWLILGSAQYFWKLSLTLFVLSINV